NLNGTGIVLKSNAPVYAWLDYTVSSTTLSVYLANSNHKPAAPVLTSTAINLASQLGARFFMGFSGSTGSSRSKHEVLQFYASDEFANPEAACCSSDGDCAGNPLGPVCDPQKRVCGQCTVTDTSRCPAQPSGCDISGTSNVCVPNCDGNYGAATTHPCASPN